jgi:hypothetical protein
MYRLAALWMATSEASRLVHSRISITDVTQGVTYWLDRAKNRLPSCCPASPSPPRAMVSHAGCYA